VEEQRVNVIADLNDGNGKCPELGDGYRFEARIVIWEGEDVLQAPTAALFREGQEWAVFVAENATARLRTVELGHRNPDAAEILRGVTTGEAVIVYPSDRVKDGVSIELRD
jgi:HlyD family secretion protein